MPCNEAALARKKPVDSIIASSSARSAAARSAGGRVPREDERRDEVDPRVGALRGQDRGDEQLQRGLEVQLAVRVDVDFFCAAWLSTVLLAPAEHRRGVAGGAGLGHHLAQVVAHPAEPGEVLVHQALRLTGGDRQLLGQAERRQPVGQAVAHRLDLAAHRGRDVLGSTLEDAGADEAVEVLAGAERLDQALVAGQVRHDPHLDLAVVGRHQRLVPLADDEDLADAAALLGADRHVLQVRVGRATAGRWPRWSGCRSCGCGGRGPPT